MKYFMYKLILYHVDFFQYILSTLKFTYPTVFQGWQTLIASIFLYIMKRKNKENLKQSIQGYGIINLLPNIVFHVCSIVAGSKALSYIVSMLYILFQK